MRKSDGAPPSHDFVHDESSIEHPRTRSQVQRMAHILQEAQTATIGLNGQKSPVLFILLLKLHCGLSVIFSHFWNPYHAYFQVQAFTSNHAHKKMGDQGILSNRPVLVQNCTVKCLSGITPFKHGFTFISLHGVCTHPKVSPIAWK